MGGLKFVVRALIAMKYDSCYFTLISPVMTAHTRYSFDVVTKCVSHFFKPHTMVHPNHGFDSSSSQHNNHVLFLRSQFPFMTFL